MNAFTLFRVHPVDYLMAEAIMLLPSVLFEDYLGIALAYLGVSRLHDALNHSNLRTNLGWLRFVFVTPQSHRVHHSLEPAYFDMNFGVTLCIWDRIFRTHSPSDFVYPATGIPDAGFPTESLRGLYRLPTTVIAQLAYPFVKVLRLALGRRVASP
jgi:sterol desaturase/sphingolipid hydroxylase (fatty acid hydroxylase superfamily)